MPTYIEQLREAAQQQHTEKKQGYSPLADQIQALVAPLPDLQRNRPWSIEEFLPQLQGRYQTRPATRRVAAALRELGWSQRRDWSAAGRNKRYWFPPQQEKTP